MTINFIVGLVGALILIVGAAYPIEKVSHPSKSVKNWLFLVGGVLMFAYALLNYLTTGGSIFFVIMQSLINVSSVFMMLDTDDRIDTGIISGLGLILVGISLYLFEGYQTIIFVAGLSGIAIGYVMKMNTFKRNFALMIGSAFVTVFSYMVGDMIFTFLNLFFAIFAGYWAWRIGSKNQ